MLDTTQRPSAASGDLLGHQSKCDQCGNPFEPRSKSGGKSKRFCSPKCRPGRHFSRGADMKLRHGKGRKALSHGARSASNRNITNRFELVRCESCGRRVKRKSRRQLYCSDRCREWSKGQRRTRKSFLDGDTSASPHPLFLFKQISGLQGQKSGSSIALNVLGGYRWPNAPGVEPGLLHRIVRAEIGGGAS